MREYDVIVCGGGPSGIIAAIAAARSNIRTAIVEQLNHFGGLATGGLVSPVSEFNKNGNRIINGIPWEVMNRLAAKGAADLSYPIGNVPFDPEVYKLVAQDMLKEAGVDIYLESSLIGCEIDNGTIRSITCISNGLKFNLKGRVFIDCTGNASLSRFAGIPFLNETEDGSCQAATLFFRLGGVDTENLEQIHLRNPNTRYFNVRVRTVLEKLKESSDVPNFGGPWFIWGMRDGIVNVNMTRGKVDLLDPLKNSQMVCKLRKDVHVFVSLLHDNIPEFRNSYLLDSAVLTGYRENRRIVGEHVLSMNDLSSGIKFSDAIACTAHPVDIHIADSSEQRVFFLDKVGYIPYRCMYNKSFNNILVAGRCISADEYAFGAIRVQAPCMAMGEAAGKAAAVACKERIPVTHVEVSRLKLDWRSGE